MAALEWRIVGGTGEKLMNSLAVRNGVPQKAANYARNEESASFLKKRSKPLLFSGGWRSARAKSGAFEALTLPTPKSRDNKSFLLLFFKKAALACLVSGAAA
jgi:hypothetical protein